MGHYTASTLTKNYVAQIARLDFDSIGKLAQVVVNCGFEYLGSIKDAWDKIEPKYLIEGARKGSPSDWSRAKLSGDNY